MCGIAGFISTDAWKQPIDSGLWAEHAAALRTASNRGPDWAAVDRAVEGLAQHFDQLQSFSTFEQAVRLGKAHAELDQLAATLDDLSHRASELACHRGAEPQLMATAEKLADYAWQVDREVLGTISEVTRLTERAAHELERPALFTAWSVARVLASVDRLEVRGRDSLGIAIAVSVDGPLALADPLKRELDRRCRLPETASGRVTRKVEPGAPTIVRFVYKVANLVGSLGDNSSGVRSALMADELFWHVASHAQHVNVIAHTRWASNGIINVPNCHPVDGTFTTPAAAPSSSLGADTMFVLNGDVDNYRTLLDNAVYARGHAIDALVSTDAKILPVLYCLSPLPSTSTLDRFVSVLRTAQGSLAVAMQDLSEATSLCVGQKGSGQALYVGKTADGWVLASEVYGLAAVCRSCISLNVGMEGGVALRIGVRDGQAWFEGRHITGGKPWTPEPESIQIFARDIHRGEYDFYIEKEINQAPTSVERTLHGKYRRIERRIEWLIDGFGRGDALLQRLHHAGSRPIRRIVCVGQGTAAVAAMGVAYLSQQALRGAGIAVEHLKASEFFGFVGNERLDDTILIAVSQSGTTTDTNRIVDIARDRGAWVVGIVNRRNSALVHKANSHLYTSSGRDVEMSVASTKAFYSQVTAGKLLALLLADQLGTMSESQIFDEITELEALPGRLREILDDRESVSSAAAAMATSARNWALVGNGANRIAAEEIRIKLSELCYKAIPCDVTEDKKHIDLSTEPLTIVVANDLPEMVVQDTVKEVSIFRAHSGKPVVLCERGETRFNEVAACTLPLPSVGGGLAFVLATMAGHLFGIAAARAIDGTAAKFRHVRARLSLLAENPESWDRAALLSDLDAANDSLVGGAADSSLPASLAAQLNRYLRWLLEQEPNLPGPQARLDELTCLNNRIIEELTRPIDTIRHQAKTVTVGISRPAGEIAPVILECLEQLGCSSEQIAETERKKLEALSPLVTDVTGALLYEVLPLSAGTSLPMGREWTIVATRGYGSSRVEQSRYRMAQAAMGSKRASLRLGRIVCRPADAPTDSAGQLVLPVLGDDGNAVRRLVLLHLSIPPDASLQQKTAMLRAFDDRLEDLRDRLADRPSAPRVEEVLMTTGLAQLLFLPNAEIVSDVAPTSR